jgi:dienelactone hydrolase
MDVYEPAAKTDATVVIVGGFPGAYNTLPFVRSLGQKLAHAGLRAVAYANREPVRDLHEVIARFDRVALWASSGNGPVALSALMAGATMRPRCAVLHYAYTFDAADAAKQYGFVDGCAGRTLDDLRSDVPLFISRAGRDQFAGLNESLDRFVSRAIARNMPVTFVNHPTGAHAFDLEADDPIAADIVRRSIEFATFHLNAGR